MKLVTHCVRAIHQWLVNNRFLFSNRPVLVPVFVAVEYRLSVVIGMRVAGVNTMFDGETVNYFHVVGVRRSYRCILQKKMDRFDAIVPL